MFEGGFLGLDNIGVFDRSAPLPTGGHLEQADGTAWMALFSQNMLELAVELAAHDRTYESMVFKFVEHFYYIAAAMNRSGEDGMWDEEDGFYYDVLRLPDGSATRLKVRSLVGLLPLCATTVIEKEQRERVPSAMGYIQERLRRIPELLATMHPTGPGHFGVAERGMLALVNPERLRRILTKMLDENEFLGPHGIRSISKFHEQHPYVFHVNGQEHRVDYLPAESEHRHVRRQLQLAGPGLDAGERAHHPGAAELLPVLRRQLQNRMPHRLRQDDEPLRGEQGDLRPARSAPSPATSRAGARSTAASRSSRPIPTGATTSSSTSTSTATTAPGWAPVTRPAGPGSSPRSSSSTDPWIPKRALDVGKQAAFARAPEQRKAAPRRRCDESLALSDVIDDIRGQRRRRPDRRSGEIDDEGHYR